MRRRRVFVTLEIDTDAPLSWLRGKHLWNCDSPKHEFDRDIQQVQINVARPEPKPRKVKR